MFRENSERNKRWKACRTWTQIQLWQNEPLSYTPTCINYDHTKKKMPSEFGKVTRKRIL